MAEWKVKVEVRIDEVLEFERTIEADSQLEAEGAAEDEISDDEIYDALKEKDACALASWECHAETDEIQCKGCDVLFPADELDANGECEECRTDEDDEEEESEATS
jgi:predicted Zn-ribbon and HTH transcriptional regulator